MTATPVMKGQQHLLEKPPRLLKQPRKAILYAQVAELTAENIRLRERVAWLSLPWYYRWAVILLRVARINFGKDARDAHPGD